MAFTALSILVACLGLFGLAAYTAEAKTKEIGIRKTLGASPGNIFRMIGTAFVKWIVIANLIAWPTAYFLLNHWLRNFAYRIHIGWELFLLSLVLLVIISLGTVAYQTIKAARSNPVDSLRHE